MIIKGIVSNKNEYKNTAEITFPEYDNVTTAELPFYNRSAKAVDIGDFVIVALFNGGQDFCDGVIL
jgi:hypothetical protein